MTSEFYMCRCLELARLGAGYVAPNPMVGAVLVHNDRIIGEGWHQRYGEAHAEVNCIDSVKEEDRPLISQSSLYVSLEPCAHHGKTPPCADLIIANRIPAVMIGCLDIYNEVNGRGMRKLLAAGVNVIADILKEECEELNKRFFTFHTEERPYIILKWAQTEEGIMAVPESGQERLLISNEYSNRLVHRWRSEEAAILVGTNTALLDDPSLTTRLWDGPSPIRLVIDMKLRLPSTLKLFNGEENTIVFNTVKDEEKNNLVYYKLNRDTDIVRQILDALYQLNIQSMLVEGGAKLIQSFIDEGVWDEIRVIKNSKLKIQKGLKAPKVPPSVKIEQQTILSDSIEIFKPIKNRL